MSAESDLLRVACTKGCGSATIGVNSATVGATQSATSVLKARARFVSVRNIERNCNAMCKIIQRNKHLQKQSKLLRLVARGVDGNSTSKLTVQDALHVLLDKRWPHLVNLCSARGRPVLKYV